MSGPEIRRGALNNLSSPSQSYTFDDSEDGDKISWTESGRSPQSNMNGAGSSMSNGSSKSARYQTALTARARQRQMRRMLERDGSGESPGGINGAASPREGERSRGRSDYLAGGNSPSSSGNSANPTAELIRSRALLANGNRGTDISNNESGENPSPNAQIVNAFYEKLRSRSLSRTKDAPSLPSSPSDDYNGNGGGGPQRLTRSPSSPDLVTSDPPRQISTTSAITRSPNSLPAVMPQLSKHDGQSGGKENHGVHSDEQVVASPPSMLLLNQSQSSRASSIQVPSESITTTPSASSMRQQRMSNITPSQEFLPDWSATKGGGVLSPSEVQDAANFTSIQFQCSMVSGEVEMLSGDDARCSNNQCWQNEVWSDVSPPSPLASGEIFHQAAAASIVALLSPDRMAKAGLMAPEINSTEEDDAAKDVAGDSPTGVIGGMDGQGGGMAASSDIRGMFTFNGNLDPSLSRGGEWNGMTQVSRSLFRGDVDDDVRQSMIFQAFRGKMIDSAVQFNQLLGQINRKRGVAIDRTFATRRKNACGALRILSAKQENRIKICWTVGVLPAITSVLSDVNEVVPDEFTRSANTEARNRIVSTLLNLSVNKKNRMLIVNTPGVLESISQTILHDAGEGRQGCCTVLLYLAKTFEARFMIVKSAGVMDALAKVIEVPKIHPKSTPKSKFLAKIRDSPSTDTGCSSKSSRHSSVSHSGSRSISVSEVVGDSVASVDSSIAPGEVEHMEITFETIDATVHNSSKAETDDMYDADPNRFLHGARLSIFACLLCLVKSQENAVSCLFDEGISTTSMLLTHALF